MGPAGTSGESTLGRLTLVSLEHLVAHLLKRLVDPLRDDWNTGTDTKGSLGHLAHAGDSRQLLELSCLIIMRCLSTGWLVLYIVNLVQQKWLTFTIKQH